MGERAFKLGDIVETTKGAKFWGEIVAFDNDEKLPGCTVRAIDPGFEGVKHVYPLLQLRLRVERMPIQSGEPVAVRYRSHYDGKWQFWPIEDWNSQHGKLWQERFPEAQHLYVGPASPAPDWLVEKAFKDGVSYATHVKVTNIEEAWRTSKVRLWAEENAHEQTEFLAGLRLGISTLMKLASPEAEVLSDGVRLTEFVKAAQNLEALVNGEA